MTDPLPYATHHTTSRPLLAAAILGALSLGLVTLAGCFLMGIGAMYNIFALTTAPVRDWTPGEVIFATTLYVCCALCLVAAGIVLVLAVRKLIAA